MQDRGCRLYNTTRCMHNDRMKPPRNSEMMAFTLWNVGHGIAIWIATPNGKHHWIDLGRNDDFSPSEHVHKQHGVNAVDYLIISHPDQDHLADLPSFIESFGEPRILRRNKTLPPAEKYGSGGREYQRKFKSMDTRFTKSVAVDEDPQQPSVNGGIEYVIKHVPYRRAGIVDPAIAGNDTSVVVALLYAGVLFVCPGDIHALGWKELWSTHEDEYMALFRRAKWRFLVAPHHGRKSAYCAEMMEAVSPHLVFISDVWGQAETDSRYQTKPVGVHVESEDRKYYSTKQLGRVRVDVESGGQCRINQYEP